jgi:hypothetical protein
MAGKTIGSPVIASCLLWLLCAAAALPAAAQARGVALGSELRGAVALVRDDPFPLKAQGAGSLSLLAELPVAEPLALGLGLRLQGTLASGLSGGFQYRGHWGAGLLLGARLGVWLPGGGSVSALRVGTQMGALLSYERYSLTVLYFFYPGLYCEPFLELQFLRLPRFTFALGLPVEYHFRKDPPCSGSVGLGLTCRYYPGGGEGPRP